MRAVNEAMYEITVGEHDDLRLPPLDFRGAPVGIDIFSVLRTGITPVIDGGLAGKDGGQIGAGVLRPELDCFAAAAEAYRCTYPSVQR
jgi:N-acetylmuramoyl-L-alanine amidase